VRLSEAAVAQWGVADAWEHRIRLLTGRTHQIRAQLAAVAAPILGDLLYTALLKNGVFQALPSHELGDARAEDQPLLDPEFSAQGRTKVLHTTETLANGNDQEDVTAVHSDAGDPEWVEDYRDSVRQETPLGLQAHKLQVHHVTCMGTPPVVYSAGTPWWRCTEAISEQEDAS
jgi:hypothetical protein